MIPTTMTTSDHELLPVCLLMQGCISTISNPYITIVFIHFHAKDELCSKLPGVTYWLITATRTIADLLVTLTIQLRAIFCEKCVFLTLHKSRPDRSI